MKNPQYVVIEQHESCLGGKAVGVEEDVGLVTGVCPKCKASFVFSYKKNAWISESEFESSLQGQSTA